MNKDGVQQNAAQHLWKLRLAMMFQYAACGSVIPFVSMLLRDRGLDYSQISFILMVSSAVLLVFPLFWGMLADRFIPLNHLFVIINLLGCVALSGLMVRSDFIGILFCLVAFNATMYPTFNLINALGFHHLEKPKEQFGKLRAWGSLGWIIPFAPISLWTAFRPEAGLDFTLYLGAILCVVMSLLSTGLPHTQPGAGRAGAGSGPKIYLVALKGLFHDFRYLVILLSFFLMSGSFFLVTFFSPPFLEELKVPRPWVGPAQAIGVVFEIALFFYQPALIRRWNYAACLMLGCVCLVVRNILFGILDDRWLLSLSYLLAGATIVFYHIGVSMLVNAMAKNEVRATAQTVLSICSQGLGPMFASWVAGHLAALYGNNLRPVFLFAAVLALLALALIAACGTHLNRAAHGHPHGKRN